MGHHGTARLQKIVGVFLAVLLAPAVSHAALLSVWSAGNPVVDDLGGSFAAYTSPGCTIELSLGEPSSRGRALEIRYDNRTPGSCGIYFHLFNENENESDRRLVDLNSYGWLTFEVKGPLQAQFRIADTNLYRRNDSAVIGRVSDFAGRAGADGWRKVSAPLAGIPLRTRDAAVLAFAFPAGSSGQLSLAQIAFASSKNVKPGGIPVAANTNVPTPRTRRAMWFWELGDCLANDALCRDAFAFARQNQIDTVFAQVPYQCRATGSSSVCAFDNAPRLREVLAEAATAGLRVHALEGAPEYALARYHPQMLGFARLVADYNQTAPPESRFAGVHFDIEPYVLLGFDSPIRDSILREYLALHREVAELLRSAPGDHIEFGADIPFWYDETMRRGVNPYVLEFNGKTQDLSRHLIDMLDNVVLMDYRNSIVGADGIAAHAAGEIAYAAGSRAQVIIGVETLPQRAESVVFLAGLSEKQWQEQRAHSLLSERRFAGFGLRTYSDGMNRYIGLAAGGDSRNPALSAALESLATVFSLPSPDVAERDAWLARARALATDYSDFAPFEAPGRAAFSVNTVPLAKLSFSGHTRTDMETVLRSVQQYFAPSPAFGGTAIHSYSSWSRMPR